MGCREAMRAARVHFQRGRFSNLVESRAEASMGTIWSSSSEECSEPRARHSGQRIENVSGVEHVHIA
jgi:hypothetical protein